MIILGLSWVLQITSLLFIMFKYPDPSLKDALINNDNHEENLAKIAKIYKVNDPKDLEIILKRLMENESEEVEEKVSCV